MAITPKYLDVLGNFHRHKNVRFGINGNLACEGRWPVLSLADSSSHRQCTVSVLIIVELSCLVDADGAEVFKQSSGRDLNLQPLRVDGPAR